MNTPAPADPDTTDFGYRRVPRRTKKPMVRAVFDSVAPRYDVMNDLMSLGIHRIWKRIFATALRPSPTRTLLDLASGTGDIAALWRQFGGGPVLLTDINASMLSVGRDRAIARARIDGLRNGTDKAAVLAEAFRVLRPGGRFFCLEFSKLQVAVLERAYERWSFDVLPRVGRVVAGDADSYQYLAESIRMFPDQETLAGMLANAGFGRVGFQNLSGGIAAIHSGWRL